MPVLTMQLEVCSLVTSTPDGACELRLEEMQSKTAPWRDKHNSFIFFFFFLVLRKKSQAMCFSQRNVFDRKLETQLKTQPMNVFSLVKVCWTATNYVKVSPTILV